MTEDERWARDHRREILREAAGPTETTRQLAADVAQALVDNDAGRQWLAQATELLAIWPALVVAELDARLEQMPLETETAHAG